MVEAECIFCKIGRGEIPAKPAYRDADVIAIEDVNPQAPTHLLVLPLRHYASLGDLLESGNTGLASALLRVAANLGHERGGDDGFRLVVNTGPHGGQTVGHLHLHVLAGRSLTWPPG
ncbi:MAG: histidine triad nucleotide-binding protein [Candidatus Tumulicola sp.]